MAGGVADPRIIDVVLDRRTIVWRNEDVERERAVAVLDLLAGNRFAPAAVYPGGYAGPYRVVLRVQDGRLAIEIAREDGGALETIILPLTRFRRPIRDYFAVCGSYFRSRRDQSAKALEAIDMARRGLHNEAATMLAECLEGRVAVDFDTARRLFTLICVLHIRG